MNRGRGAFRGGPQRGARGGGFGRGRGGSGGGFYKSIPDSITEVGEALYPCESQILVKATMSEQVPYFNGRIFLEDKKEIGKVDEILGPINCYLFSVKLQEGIKAESVKGQTKLFIDSQQLLPLSRFLPKPPVIKGVKTKKSGEAGSKGSGLSRGRGGFGGRSRGGFSGRSRGTISRGRGWSPRGASGFRGRGRGN